MTFLSKPRGTATAILVGVLLLAGVLMWQGIDPVVQALSTVGWPVLALPALVGLVFLPLSSWSWAMWFDRTDRPEARRLLRAAWLGDAVNWLLPVAQVGGDVLKARLAASECADGAAASATVVADKTGQVAAQVIATALGLGLLVARRPSPAVLGAAVGGLLLLSFLLVLFARAQQRGLFRLLARLGERVGIGGDGVGAFTQDADIRLRALYEDRRRVVTALTLRLLARAVMVLEVWIALRLLGIDASLADAAILDFLVQAVRAAAFVIPAGLGVQEWGFALLALEVGVAPGVGVALSLLRRVRELVLGVPALGVWAVVERELARAPAHAGSRHGRDGSTRVSRIPEVAQGSTSSSSGTSKRSW